MTPDAIERMREVSALLRAALAQQAEPVVCPLEIHPIHAKYCSAQVCDFCKAQQAEPVVDAFSTASINVTQAAWKMGYDAAKAEQAEPVESSAERTLTLMGYTNEGGEYWKPPLGKRKQAEPLGAVLVNRESREGVMFYSADSIPDPATLKDCFELVKVYTAPTYEQAEPVVEPPKRRSLTDVEFDTVCESNGFGAVARGEFPLVPRAMLKHLVDAALAQQAEPVALQAEPVVERKPLTKVELHDLLFAIDPENVKRLPHGFYLFARAIEKAHGIKGAV